MKRKGDHFKVVLFTAISFFLLNLALGQEKNEKPSVIELKTFDESTWSNLKNKLDYSVKKPLYEPSKKGNMSFSSPFTISGQLFQIAFFITVIGVIVFALIKLFGTPSNRRVSNKAIEYEIESLEEQIHEANLESLLSKALLEKDYKRAVRLYYLIVIRELSNKNIIFWKKDKTNAEYIREVGAKTNTEFFKELTFLFEWVWYSPVALTEAQFSTVSKKFEKYIEGLKT